MRATSSASTRELERELRAVLTEAYVFFGALRMLGQNAAFGKYLPQAWQLLSRCMGRVAADISRPSF